MKESSAPNLYVALMHHPVVNKAGEVITSAVTNLDIHDISRAVRTYGAQRFYMVTPLTDQLELVGRIASHWIAGPGGSYNPDRREALKSLHVKDSLQTVLDEIYETCGKWPKTVVTSARKSAHSIGFSDFRKMLGEETPYILTLGTAWGLSEEFIASADYVLESIAGTTGYNHLSVRSAAAIMLDRLLGRE